MVTGIGPIGGTTGVVGVSGPGSAPPLERTDPDMFSSALAQAVGALQDRQDTTNELAIKAATGELADAHNYTIAATESAVALELASAVRNRLVDAFTEVMRMQA